MYWTRDYTAVSPENCQAIPPVVEGAPPSEGEDAELANELRVSRPDEQPRPSASKPAAAASKPAAAASKPASAASAPAKVSPEQAPKACEGRTVYPQIFGPQRFSYVDDLASRWKLLGAEVAPTEDVLDTARRRGTRAPNPVARQLLVVYEDSALTCARQLAEKLTDWRVDVRPSANPQQRRVIELWLPERPSKLAGLMAQTNARDKGVRLAALAQLVREYKADEGAVSVVVRTLQAEDSKLSPAGRFNLLYFLLKTSEAGWTPEVKERARKAIDRLERDNSISDDTRGALGDLGRKLGPPPVPPAPSGKPTAKS